jgi:hypothetical protein
MVAGGDWMYCGEAKAIGIARSDTNRDAGGVPKWRRRPSGQSRG